MITLISKYLSYSLVNAGLTLLLSICLARSMSTEEFGVVGLIMAANFLLRPCASFNVIGLVAINKVKLDGKDFQCFSSNYFIFVTIVFVLMVTVSCVAAIIVDDFFWLFVIVPCFMYCAAYTDFHNAVLINDKKSDAYGVYNISARVLSILLVLVLDRIVQTGWMLYLIAISVSELLILVIRVALGFENLRGFTVCLSRKEQIKMLKFGSPLAIALFAGWGINQIDKFIVLEFFSLHEVAIYSVSYSMGVVINTLNQSFRNAIVPLVYEKLGVGCARATLRRLTWVYVSFALLGVLVLLVSADRLVPVIYGEAYKGSWQVVVLISAAFALNGVYRITGMVIEFYEKNALKSLLLIAAFLVNILTSIVAIPFLGLIAPAVGTIICYLFLAALSQYFGNRLLYENGVK